MNLTRASKTMSYLLRHSTNPCYVDLNGGWAQVEEILQAMQKKHPGFDRGMMDQIVAEDRKTRYSYDETGQRIRANQGHSIPHVVIDMEQPEPPELLYHGTATRFLPAILREGLKPMSRLYVHLSPDVETARQVGRRHGDPAVLVFHAGAFVRDGHSLFRSPNGIWQASRVPPEYLTLLEEGR